MEKIGLSLNEDHDDKLEFIEAANVGSSDEEDDDKHSRLIDAVKTLNGKNRALKTQRSEASITVSEFSLCRSTKDKLEIGDLLSSIGKTSTIAKLKRNVINARKDAKVLRPPLVKPEAERIKRSLAYKRVCKDVSKWDRIVRQNRHADQLRFPLKQDWLTLEPVSEVVKRFKVSTPLEQEIAALLQEQPEEAPKSEENDIKRLNFEEAMDMRQAMRKLRAQQSAQEAKFRRRNKIKSKRYHRILKQENLKKELKEFEKLQKTNPELAIEKFEELDRQRALERMSLRHRNTGKWAKYQMLRTKHDKESGHAIQEQIELSRALTAKQLVPSDSDDELSLPSEVENDTNAAACDESIKLSLKDSFNPWMSSKTCSKTMRKDDFTTVSEDNEQSNLIGYRRYWNRENKKRQTDMDQPPEIEQSTEKVAATESLAEDDLEERVTLGDADKEGNTDLLSDEEQVFDDDSDNSDSGRPHVRNKSDEVDEIFQLAEAKQKLKRKNRKAAILEAKTRKNNAKTRNSKTKNHKIRKVVDESLMNETLDRKQTLKDFENLPPEASETSLPPADKVIEDSPMMHNNDIVIDPHNFITVKEKVIKFHAPDVANYDEDALNDDDPNNAGQHEMNIVEAFADDDVIEEFKLEKQAIIDRDTPKDIDLTLPGWGEWGGEGIKASKKPKKRLIIKAPPASIRRDNAIGNVIINEKADEKLKPHMVKRVPFPFDTAKEFETSVQAPLGKHWNPETVFRRTIAPKIVTKKGTIIDPMDADAITEECAGEGKLKRLK